jgi:preprotein translocase subunit SecD
MNKNIRWKVITIVAVLVIFAAVGVYPIIASQSGITSPSWLMAKQLKLGLDLKGGVHLVMRVEVEGAVRLETDTTADRLREQLKQQGKIRYYGVSCDSVDATLAGLRHDAVSSIQVPINLLEREALPALKVAQNRGVGVIARECLANGLLVKTVSSIEIRTYCQSDEEAAGKAVQLAKYRQSAAENDCSLTQLALQFVSQLEGVSVTLIGVSRLEQLESLLSQGLPSPARTELGAIPHFA